MYDNYQQELAELEKQQLEHQKLYQQSLSTLLAQQEALLTSKKKALTQQLSSSASKAVISKNHSRNLRWQIEAVTQKQLEMLQFKINRQSLNPFNPKFINWLEPEVIQPFADKELALNAQMDIARGQMSATARRLDSTVVRYQSSGAPWWTDPTLVKAKNILNTKNALQSSKSIFRRR
jgi:hypothetical protein